MDNIAQASQKKADKEAKRQKQLEEQQHAGLGLMDDTSNEVSPQCNPFSGQLSYPSNSKLFPSIHIPWYWLDEQE